MKKNRVFLAAAFIISGVLSFSLIANADDDHHRKDEDHDDRYKSYQHYDDHYEGQYDEDDDHDDYEDEEYEEYEYNERQYYNQEQSETTVSKEVWYKWSRSAIKPNEVEQLLLAEISVLSLVIENQKPIQIDVIAAGSQVMVALEEAANMMGAEVTVYSNSEIIEINKDNKQLIVRNNSKVVYENMKKTPMQSAVLKQDGEYYIPISVLANGLGYEINEQLAENQNQIQLERVTQL